MLLSRRHKLIFIHIYKNAGTSIQTALMPFAESRLQRMVSGSRILPWRIRAFLENTIITPCLNPQPYPMHIKARELVKIIGRKAFESYFSFAIVRNPWDWQVSLYSFMLKDDTHPQRQLAQAFRGFDDYIRWRCAEEARFQNEWVCAEDGERLVKFIGRYERLDDDFRTICTRIGVDATLPVMNVSRTKPYQSYYTDETRELVRRTFAPDIEMFGYEFE